MVVLRAETDTYGGSNLTNKHICIGGTENRKEGNGVGYGTGIRSADENW